MPYMRLSIYENQVQMPAGEAGCNTSVRSFVRSGVKVCFYVPLRVTASGNVLPGPGAGLNVTAEAFRSSCNNAANDQMPCCKPLTVSS